MEQGLPIWTEINTSSLVTLQVCTTFFLYTNTHPSMLYTHLLKPPPLYPHNCMVFSNASDNPYAALRLVLMTDVFMLLCISCCSGTVHACPETENPAGGH